MLYTTRSLYPFAVIGNIHYAELTDLTWQESKRLIVSSRDGFLSHIIFEEEELGTPLYYHEIPEPRVQPLFEWMEKYRDINKQEVVPTPVVNVSFTSRKTGKEFKGGQAIEKSGPEDLPDARPNEPREAMEKKPEGDVEMETK